MIESRMILSWRALLYKRCRCRTSGAPSTSWVRKTAVPRTRGGFVRGPQGARGLEAEDEQQATDHQGRVHFRDVDLPHLRPRRMNDRDAGAVVELHALLRQRERAGDEGL